MRGIAISYAQVIRNVVEQAVLRRQVGVDFFGIGEHHRDDFAIPRPRSCWPRSPAGPNRIHLGSAVTVLSSDDPVRVYERFATLDAISNGRAEVILGRGSFTESFPLFGFDLHDYETLFERSSTCSRTCSKDGPVTWQGTTRAPLDPPGGLPEEESGR